MISEQEQLARLRADLGMGLPVVLSGDGLFLVAAIEVLSAERFAHFVGGEVGITARRAEILNLPTYGSDIARLALPDYADLAWVQAVADPSTDLSNPMKGPFESLRDKFDPAHQAALILCKQSRLLPAVVIIPIETVPEGLNVGDAASILSAHTSPLIKVTSARVPLEVSEAGRVHVFRPLDGGDEHYAIEIGRPSRSESVLSRLHSACFTGDLIGSLKCDCGPQLRSALRQIGDEGHGVLLYMNQEGRGIGLANKMRAYALQDQGFDTVEANHRLGFEDDERDFRLGAEILKLMGFSSVRLMTNNPAKVARMNEAGVTVSERVPLAVGSNTHNKAYLATKAKKSGHLL